MAEFEAELSGMGVAMEIPESIANKEMMAVLKIKSSKPNEFCHPEVAIPVPVVETEPEAPTDSPARVLGGRRTSFKEGSMASVKKRVYETIWFDHEKFEVTLTSTETAEEGHQEEIVNAITTDEAGVRRLEFFVRDAETKERKEWSAPKHHTIASMEKCFEKCENIKDAENVDSQ